MLLKHSAGEVTFRKENFKIKQLFYYCAESGGEFSTTKLDEINLVQVHNQYRAKHNLPFVEDIKSTRAKYELSATQMSEVLGFGTNSYRNYENGEVPSKSNGTTISLIEDPRAFRTVVQRFMGFSEKKKLALLTRIDELILEKERQRKSHHVEDYMLTARAPNVYSGFVRPSMQKLTEMVVFFANSVKPMKTKLNKLLFYADFLKYRQTGFSMSGMKYRAIQRGPVLEKFNSIFEYLAAKGACIVSDVDFGDEIVGEQFLANPDRTMEAALLSQSDLDILEELARKFENTSTRSIVDLSHREKAWLDNEQARTLISYDYAFDLMALGDI